MAQRRVDESAVVRYKPCRSLGIPARWHGPGAPLLGRGDALFPRTEEVKDWDWCGSSPKRWRSTRRPLHRGGRNRAPAVRAEGQPTAAGTALSRDDNVLRGLDPVAPGGLRRIQR